MIPCSTFNIIFRHRKSSFSLLYSSLTGSVYVCMNACMDGELFSRWLYAHSDPVRKDLRRAHGSFTFSSQSREWKHRLRGIRKTSSCLFKPRFRAVIRLVSRYRIVGAPEEHLGRLYPPESRAPPDTCREFHLASRNVHLIRLGFSRKVDFFALDRSVGPSVRARVFVSEWVCVCLRARVCFSEDQTRSSWIVRFLTAICFHVFRFMWYF